MRIGGDGDRIGGTKRVWAAVKVSRWRVAVSASVRRDRVGVQFNGVRPMISKDALMLSKAGPNPSLQRRKMDDWETWLSGVLLRVSAWLMTLAV